jgi:hypothetical protein
VIRFLTSEGVKTSEIYREMTFRYGNNCMNKKKVYEWVERFIGGRISFVDDSCPGCASTVTCVEVNEQIYQHIWNNRRISISISRGKSCTRMTSIPSEFFVTEW